MSNEWMTYAEAGLFLGIKPESVKRRARSKHWPKNIGNDGLARVQVPDVPHTRGNPKDSLEDNPPRYITPNPPPNPPHDDTRERLAAAETEVRLLRERLADLTTDRDALRDALERAASSHAEIVRPVGSGFWTRLFSRG